MAQVKITELTSFLSVRQTAQELGFSKEGIRKLIHSGEISPVSKVDDFILIPSKTIQMFKESRRKQNNPDNRYKKL